MPRETAGGPSTRGVTSNPQTRQGEDTVSTTGPSRTGPRTNQATSTKRKNGTGEVSSATGNSNTARARAPRQTNKRQKKPAGNADSDGDDDNDDDDDTPANNARNGLSNKSPITNVHAAFRDMVDRSIPLGLGNIAHHGGIELRVATMCSGTEAPVFSMKMIAEAFRRAKPGEQILDFSHVFSVEIEPFKQAYISRNTEGSIIFRDVKDFVDPNATEAPTAMGSWEKIPTDIDLLIAGCSCVDFSSLNNRKQKDFGATKSKEFQKNLKELTSKQEKKGHLEPEEVGEVFEKLIEEMHLLGESAVTFFSMLSYAKNHRPKVIILENVQGAPWNKVVRYWFPFAGYSAAWVKLDTKDFYIPQTRSRGYLVAVSHKDFGMAKAEKIAQDWSEMVQRLKRRASSPVTSWLLPAAHPLTERARQDDSQRALRGKDPDNNWERSKARHKRTRLQENLGEARPLTEWGGSDDNKPYDRMDRMVLHIQPDRVLDCIDIYYLRGLHKGYMVGSTWYTYDMRRKTRVFDLSQNIDRGTGGAPFGMARCLTPGGIHWISDQNRLMSGYETLAMQGLPLFQLDLSRETQQELRDLSGNAMTTTVVGASIIAAFISIDQNCDANNALFPQIQPPVPATRPERPPVVFDLAEIQGFSTTGALPFGDQSMKMLFKRARRYCFCNRAAKYSTDTFLECSTCNTVRCVWCARNPPHYVEHITRPGNYLLLGEVEQEVMRYFPSVIVNAVAVGLRSDTPHSPGMTIADEPEVMHLLQQAAFYYQKLHVTEVITVCYSTKEGFQLRAKLSDQGITWYLYVDPWCEIAKKCRISNTNLQQPVARTSLGVDAQASRPSLFAWEFRCFRPITVNMRVSMSEDKKHLEITVEKDARFDTFPRKIIDCLNWVEGEYEYKPACDAPETSLHFCKKNNLFLFKDTTMTGTPDKDAYVIADECRQLESHEHREVLVRFQANRNLRKLGEQVKEVSATVEGFWEPANRTLMQGPSGPNELRTAFRTLEMLMAPSRTLEGPISCNGDGSHVLADARLIRHSQCDVHEILPKYEQLTRQSGTWVYVEQNELADLHDFLRFYNVKVGGVENLKQTYITTRPSLEHNTTSDLDGAMSSALILPPIYWVQDRKGQLVPHHAPDEMRKFEQELKARPSAFEVQVQVVSRASSHLLINHASLSCDIPQGMRMVHVRYLVNPNVLSQQAMTYFPSTGNIFVPRRTPSGQKFADGLSTTMSVEPNSVALFNPQVGHGSTDTTHAATDTKHKYLFVRFRDSLRGPDNSAPKAAQPKSFKGQLTIAQLKSLQWMIQRESQWQEHGSFTETEREEFIVPDLQLRLVGSAERQVHRNGGVLADRVGSGKTVVTLGLMNHQERFDESDSITLRREDNYRLKHLKATLVVVPPHLVDQWAEQAFNFLEIEISEVVKVKTLHDLKDDNKWTVLHRLEKARLIIVSNAIFGEVGYHERLGKLAGSLNPPTIDGRAFRHWYEDAIAPARDHAHALLFLSQGHSKDEARLRRLEAKMEQRHSDLCKAYFKNQRDFTSRETQKLDNKKTPNKRKPDADEYEAELTESIIREKVDLHKMLSDFVHILECFSYARVIYDEFSYDNFKTALFAKNAHAYSKWVLSATPPTRNLRTVCGIADLVNVHVARPVEPRAGLPRITEGPKEVPQTPAEIQLSYRQVPSDRSVFDRLDQGHKFLQAFASANRMDSELLGDMRVEEVVVVCAMDANHAVHYLDLQQELRNCNFDVDLLPKNSISLVPKAVEWKGSGRAVAAQALMLHASLGPEGGARKIRDLCSVRKSILEAATDNLKILAEKSIWLANRIRNDAEEMRFANGTVVVEDIIMILRDFWEKNIDVCGGYQCWEQLGKALVGKHQTYEQAVAEILRNHPNFFTDEAEFIRVLKGRSTSNWRMYYHLKTEDFEKKRISEDEATSLLNEARINRVAGQSSIDRLQEITREDETTRKAADEEAKRLERRQLASSSYDPKIYTMSALESTCRSIGISTGGANKDTLRKRLVAHENNRLGISDYVDGGACQLQPDHEYPLFGETVNRRGGVYTKSGEDASNTSLALRNAVNQVVSFAKRNRQVRALAKPVKDLRCEGCDNATEELNIVRECGHMLCTKHLDEERCVARNSDGPLGCPSRLKNATTAVSKVRDAQRTLNLDGTFSSQVRPPPTTNTGAGHQPPQTTATGATISAKLHMLVNLVNNIPKDEYALIFVQFEAQIKSIEEAFKGKEITFTRAPAPLESVSGLTSLSDGSLIDLCAERGLSTIGHHGALVRRLEDWNERSRLDGHPKVRILKLNDCTSAGTNLQYANHVVFASPLVVDLQEDYDSFMEQARGRCLRYGQKKTVRVYHFVTAYTIEVDMLELRRQSHVLVRPGVAIGRLKECPPVKDFGKSAGPGNGDVPMQNASVETDEERVNSILDRKDVWRAMNETNWLTMAGIEY